MNFNTINGIQIAGNIYAHIQNEIQSLHIQPSLVAVLVGNNPASLRYIEQKKKWAETVGIQFTLKHFEIDISQKELEAEIHKINTHPDIHGCIVQLPLPNHIDSLSIISTLSPKKDVDGFHPENQGKTVIGDDSGMIPCTPAGIMHIFADQNISLSGKKVAILGRSNIVGKPLTNLLINAGATVVSCNSQTPDITLYTKDADIIVLATGNPGLLRADMISKEAIIIDVGFSVINGKICGDADFENISKNGNLITPVPGGVGPLTVAFLMKNTLEASKKLAEEK
ncbi:bifunctional 5,10-methylenetetrahydrofolate dehydrogenase/5,10-methenyltetrahydrofolate cyclohydrolase [Candidatus Gracilibacteria bacterium]|nr:bifunctional 5,10-methylenetetrahydrofolate dehydrogenase/5,10-methenyltetrahydrofolate cyclohydrolase [Candidatus Gracilibacteria bacterium]